MGCTIPETLEQRIYWPSWLLIWSRQTTIGLTEVYTILIGLTERLWILYQHCYLIIPVDISLWRIQLTHHPPR